jgi:NADH dehydrogenase FAD-containing subunit
VRHRLHYTKADHEQRRQRFTQETVSAVSIQFPGKTVVMSNVGYSLSCTPDVKSSTSYNAKVGSNVSYDVLVFGSGCTFVLKGDGGFENVSYYISRAPRDSDKTNGIGGSSGLTLGRALALQMEGLLNVKRRFYLV